MKKFGIFLTGIAAGVVGALLYKDPKLRRKLADGLTDLVTDLEDEILPQDEADEIYEGDEAEEDFDEISEENI